MTKKPIFVVFLLLALSSIGQPVDTFIELNSENELINIGNQIYLFEDKEGTLTIEDIIKDEYQGLFRKSEKDIPSFGVTRSKIWVKFTVENRIGEKIFLEIAQPMSWYIDFYKPDSTGRPVLNRQTGIMRPLNSREVRHNFYLFSLSSSPKPQTYYCSIQSEAVLTLFFTLGTLQSLSEKNYYYVLFFGAFSGLMIIMLLYNLFIYFTVRDKIYLYYCGYLLSGLFLFNFLSDNYGYTLNIITYFPNYLFVFTFFNVLFISLFVLKLLKAKKKDLVYKITVFHVLVSLLIAVINIVTGHFIAYIQFSQLFSLSFYIYIFIYSLWQYKNGNINARFVVFGFSFYLLGVVVFLADTLGLLPHNFFTLNAIVFGTSLEVFMFSIALGDRINIMREERKASHAALLAKTQENERLVMEQNILLEKKVAERTALLDQQAKQLSMANSTKDQLFSIIGHDLRTPIAGLQGVLTLIMSGDITQKEFESVSKELLGKVRNLSFTLNNLLKWANSQMGGMAPAPLSTSLIALANENTDFLESMFNDKKITLRNHIPQEALVWADANQISVVFRNLISNALKFTPEGGEIKLFAEKLENYWKVSIQDSGVGIPLDKLNLVFKKNQAFTTYGTKGEKGTGLGLVLCQEMIEKNNGQIGVDSQEGKGTTFFFTLPLG